ncbi:ATP-binding protein [Vulcaniibacterium tengchongense]|uniref:histidine kinase n=1 Tax=Vulcaniibacterium tengchongense TaxID=1273429 RepID=A0A3N4VLK5_9GAMM|nr:ATP-binding protein [Vulcaniibacterium tengchongense]RPE80141.1 signal transduction histidine kinase [Vulcaniibacterium tengchongense]
MSAHSLRGRLTCALLWCIVLTWAGWSVCQFEQIKRERTGLWDASLREIGEQILRSMPDSVALLPQVPPAPAAAGPADRKMSFQVWARGRLVVHSPAAPRAPLKPDFRDGFDLRGIGGEHWRVYSLTDARRGLTVQVGRSRAMLAREVHGWVRLSLLAALGLFVVFALAVWWVIGRSLRPLTGLRDAMLARRPLDLTPLPDAALPCEVRPLVQAFNAQLQRVDQALQHERRFIADAAHELRTPLAVLGAHADLALRAGDGAEREAALRRLSAGVRRSARLSEQLLDLARLDAATAAAPRVPVELAELVVIVVRDFEMLARERGQRISLRTEPGAIRGDVDQLGILLRNLVDNALRYAGALGQIAVECRRARRDGVEGLCLSVADDGPGVPAEDRARIFDRFYRAAGSAERGCGIGLSLVARIADTHGARIEVGDGLHGRGLTVAVFFALADAEAAPRAPRAEEAGAALPLLQERPGEG